MPRDAVAPVAVEAQSCGDEALTELGCHPGEGDHVDTTYSEERDRELAALCDPHVREAIERERISLRSFADVLVPGDD